MKLIKLHPFDKDGVFGCHLPTSEIHWETYDKATNIVEVLVPDEYIKNGRMNVPAIRHLYRGQPAVDNPDLARRIRDVEVSDARTIA